ncbi:MAG: hypothetical protein OXI73_15825 [Rhodospirillales bacterium]|nr:hypothetical protein [Rhodospirillales bacterium]
MMLLLHGRFAGSRVHRHLDIGESLLRLVIDPIRNDGISGKPKNQINPANKPLDNGIRWGSIRSGMEHLEHSVRSVLEGVEELSERLGEILLFDVSALPQVIDKVTQLIAGSAPSCKLGGILQSKGSRVISQTLDGSKGIPRVN